VQIEEKDLLDAAALLIDLPVGRSASGIDIKRVAESARELGQAMDVAPKTLRWKARARTGERVPWYEVPEETT
jgi:hypothetical protein